MDGNKIVLISTIKEFKMKILALSITLFLSVIGGNKNSTLSAERENTASTAKITYLVRSGWLAQTENHLLLFDYVPYGGVNLDDFVYTEFSAAEKSKKQLVIFISHEHEDHFYPKLLEWGKHFTNLKIVLGWNYESSQPGLYKLSGRDDKVIDNMKVAVHPANDAGSGLLVTVDGLTFYHAGDHAQWLPDLKEDFMKEIKYIKEKAVNIDIAFVPVENRRAHVMEGAIAATKILNPEYVFPMHSKFEDYKIFAGRINTSLPSMKVLYPKENKESLLLITKPFKTIFYETNNSSYHTSLCIFFFFRTSR
jgi:L-ascorbate metabolism protein UlaG (beta-lactamase superfamily)